MTKHRHLLLATAVLSLTAAAVAACTSMTTTGNGGGIPPSSAGPSATVAALASGSASASPSSTTQPTSSAGAIPECRNSDLIVDSMNSGAAAGHIALLVTFVNRSAHRCYLQGFPEVSLIDASGGMLLQAQDTLNGFIGGAVVDGGAGLTAPPRVVLDPIRTAMAVLEWEDVDPIQGVPGGCRVSQSAGILVTAPGSTVAARLPGLRYVCDAFQIGPVVDQGPSSAGQRAG